LTRRRRGEIGISYLLGFRTKVRTVERTPFSPPGDGFEEISEVVDCFLLESLFPANSEGSISGCSSEPLCCSSVFRIETVIVDSDFCAKGEVGKSHRCQGHERNSPLKLGQKEQTEKQERQFGQGVQGCHRRRIQPSEVTLTSHWRFKQSNLNCWQLAALGFLGINATGGTFVATSGRPAETQGEPVLVLIARHSGRSTTSLPTIR